VQFDRAHLHRADQGFGIVDHHHRLTGEFLVQRGDAGNRQPLGVFLEEQFAGDTVRARTNATGRSLSCGRIHSATLA
jgi:hypothetical protein